MATLQLIAIVSLSSRWSFPNSIRRPIGAFCGEGALISPHYPASKPCNRNAAIFKILDGLSAMQVKESIEKTNSFGKPPAKTGHVPELDGIRAISILFVVLLHASYGRL